MVLGVTKVADRDRDGLEVLNHNLTREEARTKVERGDTSHWKWVAGRGICWTERSERGGSQVGEIARTFKENDLKVRALVLQSLHKLLHRIQDV